MLSSGIGREDHREVISISEFTLHTTSIGFLESAYFVLVLVSDFEVYSLAGVVGTGRT